MKGLFAYFFIMTFFSSGAFAVDAPVSRALPQSVQNSASVTGAGDETLSRATVTAARGVSNNAPATDAGDESDTGAAPRSVLSAVRAGATASRAVVLPAAGTDAATTKNISSRDVGATIRGAGTARAVAVQNTDNEMSARERLEAAASTVGLSARASAGSINSNPAMRRAGVTVRPSAADHGGRATIPGTDKYTSSNVNFSAGRALTARATSTNLAETITEAKERLEQTAELNKSCQQQYNECMDQFCAVIDANQKRCSCSANLSKYTKVEQAVKDANTQLNEVAQRIRYVGLSADEIRAILTATEAEEALSGTRDTTESRNMLEAIENMIKDPTSVSYSGMDTYSGLDLDLDFTAGDLDDIFSLDFLNNTTGSFSNLRGTELYNAAKKRCNTILTQCKGAGATQQQITGNYDLAIDKDCIAYEQGLTKMNETLVSNVRSAQRMLQKARLAVLQNKNQYDAKGCIAALDACMTDDMVCGSNYYKCVDPTKVYIDENGDVVLGRNITNIRKYMETYSNAAIGEKLLRSSYGMRINDDACGTPILEKDLNSKSGNNGACNVSYLLTKIGTKQKSTDEGLCRPVLDKCQQYTYDANGNYKPYNDIVVNYIQRAMVNIRAAQESIISDYASTCMVDIAACYNQQVTQVNAWSSSASVNSIYNVMRGACRNVALTCAYAIFDHAVETPPTVGQGQTAADYLWPTCKTSGKGSSADICNFVCTENKQNECIELISEIFYQSLLCPDNSDYNTTGETPVAPGANDSAWVNDKCKCRSGYSVFGGRCLLDCDAETAVRGTSGSCVCKDTTWKMGSSGKCYDPNNG